GGLAGLLLRTARDGAQLDASGPAKGRQQALIDPGHPEDAPANRGSFRHVDEPEQVRELTEDTLSPGPREGQETDCSRAAHSHSERDGNAHHGKSQNLIPKS